MSKLRRPLLALSLAVFLVCLFAPVAFAQVGPVAPPPTLSLPVAVVMALSLVLGFVTQMVQTGSLLGLVVTPKAWLPGLTVLATFLGGVVAYFTGLGSAFEVSATTVVYGIAAGLASLLAGSAAGIANHAHVVTPANVLAIRAKAAAAKLAVSMLGVLAIGAALLGCLSSAPVVAVTPANQAQVSSCQNTASFHDGIVVGDFVIGGAGTTLAAVAAADSNANAATRTGLAVGATIAAGVVAAGGALAELSASNFANSQCSNVVGPLPAAVAPADGGAD